MPTELSGEVAWHMLARHGLLKNFPYVAMVTYLCTYIRDNELNSFYIIVTQLPTVER
jgi:hypothetical protein